MNSVLLFRTDRVGDFLLSLSLIKIIKKNYPNSKITVVASEMNYKYISSFNEVHEVIILKNNLLSKISLTFKLRNKRYDAIIVHDGKNRSRIVSLFQKYKKRVLCFTNLIDTQIEIIQKACNDLKITYDDSCLDFLDNRENKLFEIPFKNYIQLHFDEKWMHAKYIKKYTNIEPTKDQLLSFINKIISKNKKIIITMGKIKIKLIEDIKNKFDSSKVKIFENQNLLELENIVFNSSLLITCHGWISHIASAKRIKQIDIIDKQYPYKKWTSHFRNYNYLYRKPFQVLSHEIINLIE